MLNSLLPRLKYFLIWSSLLMTMPLLFSQTTSGLLAADEVWGGVVKLTGDVTVPEDITLTILPGTEIHFAAKKDDTAGGLHKTKSELIVKGTLLARGSAVAKITFTSDALVKAAGDWGGINVDYSHGLSTFQLEHCLIEYGESGFSWTVRSGLHSASISNTDVRYSNTNGIYIAANGGSSPEIVLRGNKIYENRSYGISLNSSGYGSSLKGEVSSSEFYNNGNTGIYCSSNSAQNFISILNNSSHNNGSNGIYIYTNSSNNRRSDYRVEGNRTFDNSHNGIYIYSNSSDCESVIINNTSYGNKEGLYLRGYRYSHKALVRGNILRDNSSNGVLINISGTAVYLPLNLTANQIYGNSGQGINCYGYNIPLNISLNSIYNNSLNGLYYRGGGIINAVYNSIEGNGGDGIYLESGNGSRLNYNNIVDNKGGFALKNGNGSAIDGRYNFWSKSIRDELAAGASNLTAIFDIYDDGTKGAVNCSSPLTANITLPASMESMITSHREGAMVKGPALTLKGIAAAGAGVGKVELTLDGGVSWHQVMGKESWSYTWQPPGDGSYILQTRVTDLNNLTRVSAQKLNLTIDSSLPTTSGALTTDEIWSGELFITGDVTIPSGVKLTIKPGTVVKFSALSDDRMGGADSSRVELIVEGSLLVEGSAASKVRFISRAVAPAQGDWHGVRVLAKQSNEQVSLAHLELLYSRVGLKMLAKDFALNTVVESSLIENSTQHGVYFKADVGSLSSLKLLNSTIKGSRESGIYLENWSKGRVVLELSGNTIRANSGYGVYLYSKDDLSSIEGTISNNEILANGNIGLYSYNSNYGKSSLTILNNRVGDNLGHGIHTYSNGSGSRSSLYTIVGNTIYNNREVGIFNSTAAGEAELNLLDNTVYGNSQGIQVSSNSHYGQTVFIRGNTLRDNSKNGLYIYRSNYSVINPSIIDNKIFGNGESGITINKDRYKDDRWKGFPLITFNRVYNNRMNGIYCQSDGGARLFYNEIRDNSGDGVELAVDELSIVNYNSIFDNRGSYALKNSGPTAIEASYNFWRKSIHDEIAAGSRNLTAIYDNFDEAAKGVVTCSSHLTAAEPQPLSMESVITSHADGLKLKTSSLHIKGIAAARAGVDKVELSLDNGGTWHQVTGRESWSYDWQLPGDGSYTLLTRVTDLDNKTEVSPKKVNLIIDSSLPTTSGTLVADEVWQGELLITGDVTVPSGMKLTIKAGTVVKFAALSDDRAGGTDSLRSELIVRGSLLVEGSAASKVRFTSQAAAPAQGDWYGVRVLADQSNEQVSLAHLELLHSRAGLRMWAKSFALNTVVDGSLIENSGKHGLFFKADTGSLSSLKVTGSTIKGSSESGIYLENWSRGGLNLELGGNTISAGKGYGVYLYTKDDLSKTEGTIGNNEILNNGNTGLYVYNSNYGRSSLSILNNRVGGSGKQGIYTYSNGSIDRSSDYTIEGNTVYNNLDTGIYNYSSSTDCEVNILSNTLYNNSHGIQVESYDRNTQRAYIRGNTVRDNRKNGIYVYNRNYSGSVLYVDISGNEIYDNRECGIILSRYYAYGLLPLITLNRIYNNGKEGIFCLGSEPAILLYNEIRDNTGDGIYLYGGSGTKVNYNNIFDNRGSFALKNTSANAVDARNNFWRKSMLDEITAGDNPKNLTAIYDNYDGDSSGPVDYSSHLTAALSLPASMESVITSHTDGLKLKSSSLNIRGIAAAKAGIGKVELSVDNGLTWHPVTGKESWSYEWQVPGDGLYTLLTRVTDLNNITQLSSKKLSLTIDSNLPTTSGALSGDEVWSGRIELSGDVTVPSGVKLTIKAGTIVTFPALSDDQGGGADSQRCELIVQGSLFVEGAAASKVHFTSQAAAPAQGDWYGVRVQTEESNEELHLAHMELTHSTRGLEIGAKGFSRNTVIESSTVSGTGGHGLYFKADAGSISTLKVTDSTFSANGRSGIYLDNLSSGKFTFELKGSKLGSNGEYGLYMSGQGAGSLLDGVIRGNELSANTRQGLYFSNNSSGSSNLSISYNTVHDNKQSGIDIYSRNSQSLTNLAIIANEIYNNQRYGLLLHKYYNYGKIYPIITLNSIYNNSSSGLSCNADGNITILYNTIRSNRNGVDISGGTARTVGYNNIIANRGSYDLNNGTAGTIDARFNCWRLAMLDEIKTGGNPKNISAIYDKYDNSGRGVVNYSAHFSSEVAMPASMESVITSHRDGARLKATALTIGGLAVAKEGVSKVEISTDNGLTWHPVTGKEIWSYRWHLPGDGSYTLLTRVTDLNNITELSPQKVKLTIDSSLPTTAGTLTTDEVWSGELLITGDVTVPSGRRLTIKPGTVVKFASFRDDLQAGADSMRSELIVRGSLFVEGTAASKARFISSAAAPAKGDWYGIRVLTEESNEQLNLAHMELSHSSRGVEMAAKSFSLTALFDNTIISGSGGHGIYFKPESGSSSTLKVRGSDLSDHEGSGIYVEGHSKAQLQVELLDNRVAGNKGEGIYLNSKDNGTVIEGVVSGNESAANGKSGIYSHTSGGNIETFIEQNLLYNNNNGIQLQSSGDYDKHRIFTRDNIVRDNRDNGIYVYAHRYYRNPAIYVEITGNEIFGNVNRGLYLTKGYGSIYPAITLNKIYNNGKEGIYCNGNGVVNLLYNSVRENGGSGLYLQGGAGSSVNYNNLVDNKGTYALSNGSANDINGRYNFWSRSILAEMAAGLGNIRQIYDFNDRTTIGSVDHSFYLTTAITLPIGPTSNIIAPADGSVLKAESLRIEGIAVAREGINRVEVSPDKGINWYPATGSSSWIYEWQVPGDGVYTLLSRVIDNSDNIEGDYNRITITIDSKQPTTSGTLAADEVWKGEVLITGDVTVPDHVKLTIEPGTTVKFAALRDDRSGGVNRARSELIIKGQLSAVGTSLLPITFRSDSAVPAKGDWYGIRVLTESKETDIRLENYRISHCHSALEMVVKGQMAALTMIEGEISGTLGDAIHFEGAAKAELNLNLSGNSISDSGGYGIYSLIKNSGSLLEGALNYNSVTDSVKSGIYLHSDDRSSSNVEVSGNILTKNGGQGVYAYNIGGANSELRITGNRVTVTGDGIYVNLQGGTVNAELSDNEVSNNLGSGLSLNAGYSSTLYSRILRNRSYKNRGDGIRINRVAADHSRHFPLIAFNTVYDNISTGIYSFGSDKARINYNNIYGNSGYALHNESSSVIDARHNWWGEKGPLESDLYDHNDDQAKGRIDYSQALSALSDHSGDRISKILSPVPGTTLPEGSLTVEGLAFAGEQIGQVELSYDAGLTWHQVTAAPGFKGRDLWNYHIEELLEGIYRLQTRVVDRKGTLQSPVTEITINVAKDALTTAGVLQQDQSWSGVVRLSGDVTLPAGVTLTIMPGTRVEVPALADSTYGGTNSEKTELIINGTLLAAGTESEPVTFTTFGNSIKSRGDWVGIRGSGEVTLEHVKLEYGEKGVHIFGGGEMLVRSSTIANCSGSGLYYELGGDRSSDILIENSTILNNGANGFHLYSRDNSVAQLTFRGNRLSGNGENGLYCQADGSQGNPTIKATVIANVIDKSKKRGLYFYTQHGGKSELSISNNEIHHSAVAIYSQYYYSGSATLQIEKNSLYSGTKGIEVYTDYCSLNPVIKSNTIYNNSQDAIRALYNRKSNSHTLLPQIEGNHCYDNSGNGIYLKSTAEVAVTNNSLYNNGNYALYNEGAAPINARGNWWGVTVTDELAKAAAGTNISTIYDKVDNSSKGLVDFSLWKELFVIPAIPVLEPVTSPTKMERQLLKGSKEAGNGIVINGELVVPIDDRTDWGYDYLLSEGENRLKIYAENSEGMSSETVEAIITLDSTAPVLFSSSPAQGAVVRRNVKSILINLLEESSEIDGTATIGSAKVLDGQGNPVAGSWSSSFYRFTFTPNRPLAEGEYSVTMNPVDSPLANTGAFSINFSVDLQPPAAPLIEPFESPTNVAKQTIKGRKEAGSSVWINDMEVVPGTTADVWHHELTLAEGVNSYTLYLKDRAGNRSPEITLSITLDTKAPQLKSTVPTNNSYVGSPAELRVAYLEETTAINGSKTVPNLSMKNSKGQAIAGQWSVINGSELLFKAAQTLWEESYSVTLKVYDLAGNSSSDSFSFTVDSTAPDSPTLKPVESPTRLSLQTLSGTKEAGSSIWLNGREVVPGTAATSWSYELRLREGENPLELHSRDRAGNRSVSIRGSISYDDVAPLPVATLKVDGRGSGTVAALDWTGYDESRQGDLHSYNVYSSTTLITQLTGLTPLAILPAGTFTYRAEGLTRGTKQYFAVVAIDSKGNSLNSVTPVSAVMVDIEAPEDVKSIRVNSYENRLVFNWEHSSNSAADLAAYRLYFNGSAAPISIAKESNRYELSGLSNASSYPVRISAVDGEGNESGGLNAVGVTLLDNPVGLTTDPQNGYIELSWTAPTKSELVKHYNIYLNEGQFHNVSAMQPRASVKGTKFKLSGLTNGVNYFMAVTAVNLSGGEKKEVLTIFDSPVPDTTGPQIVNVNWNGTPLAAGQTLLKPGEFQVNAIDPMGVGRVEFRVDGKLLSMDSRGSDGYSATWNIYETGDGPHELVVVAYDSIGNSSSWKGSLNVNPVAPGVPLIESPASNLMTNRPTLQVAGKADPYCKIILYRGGVDTGIRVITGSKGEFQGEVELSEGLNSITAKAFNRAGNSGESTAVTVTFDNTRPAPPTGLTAEAGKNGTVKLGWSNGSVPNLKGFNIYRSEHSFKEKGQAVKINKIPVPGNIYKDLLARDGRYYYRFTTLDEAGNESLLSREISAVSDSKPPEALSISYSPEGAYDALSNSFAPGKVGVTLKVSEQLLAVPYLSIMAQDRPVVVELTGSGELEYQGSFVITNDLPAGAATVQFAATDLVGNRGTAIKEGGSFKIDNSGPEVGRIELIPGAPLKSEQTAQVEIRAIFSLTEPVKVGIVPLFSYLLSGTGRQSAAITSLRKVPASGFAEGWEALFTLPADAALTDVEMLSFSFSAEDELGNVGSSIRAFNSFEIYSGSLPALEPPQELQAEPIAGGKIRLAWHPVEGAFDYRLLRKGPGEADYSLYKRSAGLTEYIDNPGAEGLYSYLVTAVRSANGEESFSPHINSAEAISDKTAPEAPSAVKAELLGSGIMLSWQESASTEPVTYRIYRAAGSELTSTAGLIPLQEGIRQTVALDPAPSAYESCYALTAVDSTGNESAPSNYVYLNYRLLPVSNLKVSRVDDEAPVISWSHSGANITGYDIYLDSVKGQIRLNRERLQGQSFTDGGYTIDERSYTVKAVDNNGFEGPGREILLPAVSFGLKGGAPLKRGLVNRVSYFVENGSNQPLSRARLMVEIAGKSYSSDYFSLAALESRELSLRVGGYSNLPDLTELRATLEISYPTAELVEIVRTEQVRVTGGQLNLSISNEQFIRGLPGTISFRLDNSSLEELTLLPEEIGLKLLDSEGNLLSRTTLKEQKGGAPIKIASHSSLSSGGLKIEIPSQAPERVGIEVEIERFHFGLGRPDYLALQGQKTSREVTLIDTAYYGEITSITQSDPYGKEPILIKGRALERRTKSPLAHVSLNLIVSVNGFERVFKMFTAADGTFSHNYRPVYGEAGIYNVATLHPDLKDRPQQGTFVIRAVEFDRNEVKLTIPKNYRQKVTLKAKGLVGTDLKNLRLLYRAEDQPGGVLPAGVHLELPPVIAELKGGENLELELAIRADSSAAEKGKIVLKAVSDEAAGLHAWHSLVINTNFMEPQPQLTVQPSFIESGVSYNNTVNEQVTIENRGLAPLEHLRLRLLTGSGLAAPGWAYLTSSVNQGTLKVGERRMIGLCFSPDRYVAEGTYNFNLQVTGSKGASQLIPIFVNVVTDDKGSVLFKLANIYTDTKDRNGKIIEGLSGAKLKLQNEKLLSLEYNGVSDAKGELILRELPAGRYRYRVSATKHNDRVGTLWVKAGTMVTEELFMSYNLVSVEWGVSETTIKDSYELEISTTYETDVPAALVICEPASISIPPMSMGEVYRGVLKFTNYGLIRAENVSYKLPADDRYFKYEMLGKIPSSIEAKESVLVPFKITALTGPAGRKKITSGNPGDNTGDPINPGDNTGDQAILEECFNYTKESSMWYIYRCSNGMTVEGVEAASYFVAIYGDCSKLGPGGWSEGTLGRIDHLDPYEKNDPQVLPPPLTDPQTGSGGGGGSVNIDYYMPPNLSGPAAVTPKYIPIEGVVCGPKIYCEVTDECCKAVAREHVKGEIDLLTGEYNLSARDLSLSIGGYNVDFMRYFFKNRWHFTRTLHNLDLIYGVDKTTPQLINKNGVSYEMVDEAGKVFSANGHDYIFVESNSYLWKDRVSGEWKRYNAEGLLLSQGDRYEGEVRMLYNEGRLSGMTDKTGVRHVWLEYNAGGQLSTIRDSSNRSVNYEYNGARLEAVKDMNGNYTRYSYDQDGKVISKSDVTGESVTIDYNRGGYVERFNYSDGSYKKFDYNYDSLKRLYYTGVTYSSGKVVERWFDESGARIRTDINGVMQEKVEIEGRRRVEIDPLGNKTVKEYDEWNNLIKLTLPDGSSTSYRYDSESFNLLEESGAGGVKKVYTYNNSNELIKLVERGEDGLERVLEYSYDSRGNLLTTTAGGVTLTMSYDSENRVLTSSDGEGNVTGYSYDAEGYLTKVTDGENNSWLYSYDRVTGKVKQITDPLNNSNHYEYDSRGNLKSFTDAEGRVTLYEYDMENRLIKQTNSYGRFVEFRYNFEGWLIEKIFDGKRSEKIFYNAEGKAIRELNIAGLETTAEYDDLGRPIKAVNREGESAIIEYDRGGRVSKISYPDITQSLEYDERGRLIRLTGDDGKSRRVESYQYNSSGKVTALTDGRGATTRYSYDSFGRMVSRRGKEGESYSYTFDSRDNLVSYTDPAGNISRYEYDLNNRLMKKIYPDGSSRQIFYDRNGRISRLVDPEGQMIKYDYDGIGQIIKQHHYRSSSDLTPEKTVSYSYDKLGRMTSWSDGSFSRSNHYDDRLMQITTTIDYGSFSKSISYSYDELGRVSSFKGSEGTNYDYHYDSANRLSDIIIPGEGAISYENYRYKQVKTLLLPGGIRQSYGYDVYRQLSSYQVDDIGGKTLVRESYKRDNTGLISAKSTLDGLYSYKYDGKGQLLEVNAPEQMAESYLYDAAGNRTNAGSSWSYNRLNQLEKAGETTFTYDLNGNMTARLKGGESYSYHYDIENRLTKIEGKSGAVIAEYAYGAMGHRLKKVAAGVTTYYLYSEEGLIAEYDESGKELKSYGYKPDSTFGSTPLFMREKGRYYYYLTDYKGAPLKMVGKNGALVWQAGYDSAGKAVVSTDSIIENNLRGSSQYYDKESGLHYNRHRYYDPSVARYISRDPLEEAGGDNIYLFAGNNSINNIDPLGLKAVPIICDTMSFNFSTELSAGFALSLGTGISYEVCDCCDLDSRRVQKGAWKSATTSITVGMGLGLGAKLGFGIVDFDINMSIMFANMGTEATITKGCEDKEPSLSITLFLIEGKNLQGSLSMGPLETTVTVPYSIKASAEAYAKLRTRSLTVGFKYKLEPKGSAGFSAATPLKLPAGAELSSEIQGNLPLHGSSRFSEIGDRFEKSWSW